jgi:hypothetical protein
MNVVMGRIIQPGGLQMGDPCVKIISCVAAASELMIFEVLCMFAASGILFVFVFLFI